MEDKQNVNHLSVINGSNSDISSYFSELKLVHSPSISSSLEVTIWGGTVANCAESDISMCLFKYREHLRKIIYFPSRTKGGVMIRPLYFRGDRQGHCEYKNLTDLTMPFIGLGLFPERFGWIIPDLRYLTFIIDSRRYNKEGFKYDLEIFQTLFQQYSNLKMIQIKKASPDDQDMLMHPMVKARCPVVLEYNVKILLFLAIKENSKTCPFSQFPLELMKTLLSYLCSKSIIETF